MVDVNERRKAGKRKRRKKKKKTRAKLVNGEREYGQTQDETRKKSEKQWSCKTLLPLHQLLSSLHDIKN